MLAGHRGELVGMPEGELAQQDPQRRGRIHLVEHPGRAAGAQHVHIVDAVRPAHHARNDRGQLPGRIDRARGHPGAGQLDVLADQPRKTGLLSQFQHRHQTRRRHQIRLVEHRRPDCERMRRLHRKCLPNQGRFRLQQSILSQVRRHFRCLHADHQRPTVHGFRLSRLRALLGVRMAPVGRAPLGGDRQGNSARRRASGRDRDSHNRRDGWRRSCFAARD